MQNLIKSNKITPCELCERMAKYKGAIDRDALKIIKSEKIAGRGAAKETMENFSELLCRKLKGDTTVEGTIKALVNDLITRKIPISFIESFVFGFKDIILPYIQKEFSDSYYGSYNAQKITDAALRHIWMTAIDEYYAQTTETLERSEKRFRTLFDSSRDAIMTIAPPSWKFTSGNPATVKMFRAKNEAEFVSKGPWEVSPKYQLDGQLSTVKAKKMIMKAVKEGSNFFEWTHKRISGEDFPATVLLTRMEIDGKPLVQATVRDITKEKKAEEAVRESKARFQSLTENISDWIWEVNANGVYTYASPKVKVLLGYEPKDVIGKTPFDFMPSSEAKRIRDKFLAIIRAKKPINNLENINRHKNGKLVVMETSGIPIFDADGKFCGYRGSDRDITERMKVETRIRESENNFRAIFDNAGDGILVADMKTKKFVMANRKICRMLGYTENELKRIGVLSIHPKKDLPFVLSQFKLQGQKKITVARSLPMLRKNKTVFYADVSATPFVINGKAYLAGFFRPST